MSDFESDDPASSPRCLAMEPHLSSSLPACRSVRLAPASTFLPRPLNSEHMQSLLALIWIHPISLSSPGSFRIMILLFLHLLHPPLIKKVEGLRNLSTLLLSVAEVVLPPPRLPLPLQTACLLQQFLLRSPPHLRLLRLLLLRPSSNLSPLHSSRPLILSRAPRYLSLSISRSSPLTATSAPPPSPTLPDAQPTPRPHPLGFTLANARPGLSLGRPYTPMHTNVSLMLRSKILQGQLINLVFLILPSPEVDHRVASSDGFTAVFKSSDPCLSKDLSIGEFVAAFSRVSRDVICSVYPKRTIELDTCLSLFADLLLTFVSVPQILLCQSCIHPRPIRSLSRLVCS
ncbi:hypothetical protein AMECASPLE_028912 [Ameca splendens]|uniref:Uncharacterized protein n=1 Tax=Ameca splendens TaxID=208324 RepID=A0ABV0Y5F1_9TELE